MKRLLLFLLLPLSAFYAQGQTSDLFGVWTLDSIVMNKDESPKVISIEDIAPELAYDCPTEVDIQSDMVSVKLIDGTTFSNIFCILENDDLTVSILPTKTSTYKVKFEKDMIILNQKKESVEYTYIYKSKK